MGNTKGRLAEAYTGASASKITDLGFTYSARGEVTDAWELTPNSGGYYHPTAGYWANGALNSLWISTLPSISYGADGEGRASTVSASSGQNPVTSTTYNVSGQVTGVTLGSGDSDSFAYDANTGRMTQYKYTVSGSSEIGNLTWNSNGSLKTLGITDPFNAGDAQTCNYAHDDISRISSANCGSVWSQTFSYDPFGNVTKNGSSSWQPGYNTSTNRYALAGTSYDSNGNLLNDSFHSYTLNAEGRPVMIDAVGVTYDALGRMVEQNQSGSYYQIVYTPTGSKLGVFKGSTIQQLFVPLPGGAAAEYLSWGLSHYRHSDWLGSDRLEASASTTHSILDNNAYAPFGEPYAQTGNGEISFTGQNKDTVWLQYDFLARQYDPRQGRWISPDPMGSRAADPTDAQSWNRYAYTRNSPLALTDPLGLWLQAPGELPDAPQPQECSAWCPEQPLPPTSARPPWINADLTFSRRASDRMGSTAQAIFHDPSINGIWSSAAGTMNTVTGAYAGAFVSMLGAPMAASSAISIAARGVGWSYGLFGTGTGVVLGNFDAYTNYVTAAKSIGANALNNEWAYDLFNGAGEWWTLNQSFLNASIFKGQQFFMSTPVLGATGNYALELEYLMTRGIGPQQWQMVPLPY
jgi:RHS repeat-associated protein